MIYCVIFCPFALYYLTAYSSLLSTASVAPQLWQPSSGTLMINDTSETSPAEDQLLVLLCLRMTHMSCLLLVERFLCSTWWHSTFIISLLHNLCDLFYFLLDSNCLFDITRKSVGSYGTSCRFLWYEFLNTALNLMTTFMPPPPAANFLAFHPQDNNIIAIGMEDSSIQIYNVRVDEVMMLILLIFEYENVFW